MDNNVYNVFFIIIIYSFRFLQHFLSKMEEQRKKLLEHQLLLKKRTLQTKKEKGVSAHVKAATLATAAQAAMSAVCVVISHVLSG
jgi:hypothetical protein